MKKQERKNKQNGHFCSGVTQLNERLGELRGWLRNTVKLICLNSFSWTVLHVSHMLLYITDQMQGIIRQTCLPSVNALVSLYKLRINKYLPQYTTQCTSAFASSANACKIYTSLIPCI